MALKTFPNGLRFGIQETDSERLACVAVHIIGGSQSEVNYQSGVGEFVSRMLLEGTTHYPSREILANTFKKEGIIFDSDCQAENLLLICLCQNDKIEKALELLSEVVFDSKFETSAADYVRNSILADIETLQDSPYYQLTKLTNNTMFSRTGLANPRFGTQTTIERMKAEDAKNYLSKLLTPKNTVIAVTGDVDSDQVYEIIMKKWYTRFIENTDYKKLKYVAHVDDNSQTVITRNKKLNQSRIMMSFPSPDYRHIKRHALDIALPLVLENLKKHLSHNNYFHNEKVEIKKYAANGRLSFELMVDGEHTKEYIADITKFMKNNVTDIDEDSFEREKNIYTVRLLEKYDNVRNLAIKHAKEIALNKQSFSLNSELLNVSMMSVTDAIDLLHSTIDFTKATICYLGSPMDEEEIEVIINK